MAKAHLPISWVFTSTRLGVLKCLIQGHSPLQPRGSRKARTGEIRVTSFYTLSQSHVGLAVFDGIENRAYFSIIIGKKYVVLAPRSFHWLSLAVTSLLDIWLGFKWTTNPYLSMLKAFTDDSLNWGQWTRFEA